MESGQTGTRFPKPNVINVCFVSIFSGFITGKEDHYYILSLRTLILASFLLAWPGILLSVAAIITAKKAQELDIEGNKTEAERKGSLARNLNIASYITTVVYFVLLTAVLSAAIYVGIVYR